MVHLIHPQSLRLVDEYKGLDARTDQRSREENVNSITRAGVHAGQGLGHDIRP